MNNKITIAVIMLMLASGFIFISYDRSDRDIKLMSDDDYEDLECKGPVPQGYDLEHFMETCNTFSIEPQVICYGGDC